MSGQQRVLAWTAIERTSILRSVEGKLDRIDAAGAQLKRGAAENHADRYPWQKAPPHDYQDDHEQGHIFQPRKLPRAGDQPTLNRVVADGDEEPTQYAFGCV